VQKKLNILVRIAKNLNQIIDLQVIIVFNNPFMPASPLTLQAINAGRGTRARNLRTAAKSSPDVYTFYSAEQVQKRHRNRAVTATELKNLPY
jgi:hypothetical protein